MRRRIFVLTLIITLVSVLTSCAVFRLAPIAELDAGEYVCRLYGMDYVTQIKVISPGGEELATLHTSGMLYGADVNYGFELIDMNFDGVPDMRLIVSDTDGLKYSCWIWQPGIDTVSTDRLLNSLINPTFDPESKSVQAKYYTYKTEPAAHDVHEVYVEESGTLTYQWRQGALTTIKKECVSYYSESEIYCVAVWEIDFYGELEVTEERWLTPEQYERAGYLPIGNK